MTSRRNRIPACTAGPTGEPGPALPASGARTERASLDKSSARIRSMFDGLAGRYDLLDRLFSLGLDGVWRRKAVRALGLRPGDRVLDVATGTGELARVALDMAPGAQVVGLDFALEMLRRGRDKLAAMPIGDPARPSPAFVPAAGDALRLPFPDGSFDAVMIAYGLRNTADSERALDEFRRVLDPDGKLLVLEFGLPRSPVLRGLFRWYFHRLMPRVAGWSFGHREPFAYLAASVEAYPDAPALAALMTRHGFLHERTLELTFGISHALIARATGPAR